MRAYAVSVAFALLSSFLLCIGQTGDVIPFGDGGWFAKRAIELHGLLHTGQFSKFIDVLTSPTTFTFLPTCFLFLLLPSFMATGAAYGIINCLCWNLMLACGLQGIHNLLGRPQLAPWLFLLTAANNYALDGSYHFYMDLPFSSWALVAVWLQAVAWHREQRSFSLLAGIAAGSLFFVKPANAFLFVCLFYIAEATYAALLLMRSRSGLPRTPRRIATHAALALTGTFAISVAAIPFGLLQVVASRMAAMQTEHSKTQLDFASPLRAFYFPLCLSYYYSFLWLAAVAAIITAAIWQSRLLSTEVWGGTKPRAPRPFEPCALAIVTSLAVSYVLVWGLAFSFFMPAKVIRSLPLMLPIFWTVTFFLLGSGRVSTRAVAAFSLIYFSVAQLQAFFGPIPKTNRTAEHYYLVDDWLNRLPGKKDFSHHGAQITKDIEQALRDMDVKEGRVADGTEMMFWTATSLNWTTQVSDLRLGKTPRLEFLTACDNRGFPIRNNLDGCNALLLVLHPSLQYSQGVYEFNRKTAEYALRTWKDKEARDIRVFYAADEHPLMAVVALHNKLSLQSLYELMQSEFPQGFSQFVQIEQSFDQRKSLRECIEIIFSRGRLDSD